MAELYVGDELRDFLVSKALVRKGNVAFTVGAKPACFTNREEAPAPGQGGIPPEELVVFLNDEDDGEPMDGGYEFHVAPLVTITIRCVPTDAAYLKARILCREIHLALKPRTGTLVRQLGDLKVSWVDCEMAFRRDRSYPIGLGRSYDAIYSVDVRWKDLRPA